MKICSTSVRPDTIPIENIGIANCNDQIAARAFGADKHVRPTDWGYLKAHDVVFATMWKVKTPEIERRWMEVLHRLKDETDVKVVLFQEAETPWPTTRPWDEQKSFIELLGKVDLFLTHNQRDIDMWGLMRKGRPTYRWRTCLDLTSVHAYATPPHLKVGRPIICGSSYDQRANGLAGLVACTAFPAHALWHQNRSTGYEDRNRELPGMMGIHIEKEISHGSWWHWMRECSGAYLAVHPMPAASAGRDQICFAAMGIPCIGSMDLDIQMELFPRLCVNHYDVAAMKKLIRYVLEDDDAYRYIRQYAMDKVKSYGIPDAEAQAKWIMKKMGWEA